MKRLLISNLLFPYGVFLFFAGFLLTFPTNLTAEDIQRTERRLSLRDYRSKLEAGWIGQIAGVCWGEPTEFNYKSRTIPENEMPEWKPEYINRAFHQDDLYVEMTFLRTLETHGLDVSPRQAGLDFANSQYRLWHANVEGRENLRRGIAPPDSGHPRFNKCCDDIDYQIEADYSGLVAPGMPNTVIKLGNTFGRMMNYGDGLYAGVFVGAMYAEAYFESDVQKIIDKALESIPVDSQYAEMVRDVRSWHREFPDDWTKAWSKINEKYHLDPKYRRVSCDPGDFNIDAKINGAYVLTGLLYGNGDVDRTIVIATRCGQDSDCNPSSAAGVLATSLGIGKISNKFTEKLDQTRHFEHTAYSFPVLLTVCEKITRAIVLAEGGRIEKNDAGEETFVIPVKKPVPGPYQPSFQPGEESNVRFTAEEMSGIKFKPEGKK